MYFVIISAAIKKTSQFFYSCGLVHFSCKELAKTLCIFFCYVPKPDQFEILPGLSIVFLQRANYGEGIEVGFKFKVHVCTGKYVLSCIEEPLPLSLEFPSKIITSEGAFNTIKADICEDCFQDWESVSQFFVEIQNSSEVNFKYIFKLLKTQCVDIEQNVSFSY